VRVTKNVRGHFLFLLVKWKFLGLENKYFFVYNGKIGCKFDLCWQGGNFRSKNQVFYVNEEKYRVEFPWLEINNVLCYWKKIKKTKQNFIFVDNLKIFRSRIKCAFGFVDVYTSKFQIAVFTGCAFQQKATHLISTHKNSTLTQG
jgi:hypothetical protein